MEIYSYNDFCIHPWGENGHMFIILKHEYDLMPSLDIKVHHISVILYQKHCYQVNFSITDVAVSIYL